MCLIYKNVKYTFAMGSKGSFGQESSITNLFIISSIYKKKNIMFSQNEYN